MSLPSMIPVRDDAGTSSMSTVEREFLLSAACAHTSSNCLRSDGRLRTEPRSHSIAWVRWDHGASATVTWGKGTRVTCTCTGTVLPPNADRPNEGIVANTVDLSPSASTSFRNAQAVGNIPNSSSSGGGGGLPPDSHQKLLSNRILRCLERMILLGGTLDTEALCITPGLWVWKLQLAVTVLDAAAGNLLDASALATVAALSHYRTPQLELNNNSGSGDEPRIIPADWKAPTPLPLHHTPLPVSFALLASTTTTTTASSFQKNTITALVDPHAREELVMAGALTIALNVHGEVCLLDWGGGCELEPRLLKQCHDEARTIVQQQCQLLESALKQADEQANAQRLRRLQEQQQQQQTLPPLPPSMDNDDDENDLEGIPYYYKQQQPSMQVELQQEQQQETAAAMAVAMAERQAEEAYRQQALDYNVGHMASKLGQDKKDHRQLQQQQQQQQQENNSLLDAMLKSVMATAAASAAATTDNNKPPKLKTTSTIRLESDDEEETTVQLTSEYTLPSLSPPPPPPPPPSVAKAAPAPTVNANDDNEDDEDDVDDLAAAIKKKKKKSKKSKK